jgi:hypothetical protein
VTAQHTAYGGETETDCERCAVEEPVERADADTTMIGREGATTVLAAPAVK